MADELGQQTGVIPDVAGQEAEVSESVGGETEQGGYEQAGGVLGPEAQRTLGRVLSAERQRLQEKYQIAQAVAERLSALTGRSLEEIYSDLQSLQPDNQTASEPPEGAGAGTQSDAATRNLAVQSAMATVHLWRQAELNDLRQDPRVQGDAELQKPEKVAELVQVANQMGIGLKQAYWLVHGDRRAQELQREVEQRVLENIRSRAGLTAEGDVVAEAEKLNLTPDEIAAARIQGMDPKDYAALKEAVDLDSFRELKKRVKGG